MCLGERKIWRGSLRIQRGNQPGHIQYLNVIPGCHTLCCLNQMSIQTNQCCSGYKTLAHIPVSSPPTPDTYCFFLTARLATIIFYNGGLATWSGTVLPKVCLPKTLRCKNYRFPNVFLHRLCAECRYRIICNRDRTRENSKESEREL